MTTYTVQTRQRVLNYLQAKGSAASPHELQYLGLIPPRKQIRSETLKLILADLEKENLITTTTVTHGRQHNKTITLKEATP